MPERPRPDIERVRDALREHDEAPPEEPEETEEDEAAEDDAEA